MPDQDIALLYEQQHRLPLEELCLSLEDPPRGLSGDIKLNIWSQESQENTVRLPMWAREDDVLQKMLGNSQKRGRSCHSSQASDYSAGGGEVDLHDMHIAKASARSRKSRYTWSQPKQVAHSTDHSLRRSLRRQNDLGSGSRVEKGSRHQQRGMKKASRPIPVQTRSRKPTAFFTLDLSGRCIQIT